MFWRVENEVWSIWIHACAYLGFFRRDAMDGETTLNIVDQTEVFTSLFDGDHIHETSWEVGIGTDLAVNLDQTLHDDLGHLGVCL